MLVAIGVFFLAARPALLPEDARFMGSTVDRIVDAVPTLGAWLRRVFWVLGGYIATTGVLVVYIANTGVRAVNTGVRAGNTGALAVLAVAALTSIGWMAVVNFMIRSDFRWALLSLAGLWVLGLLLATGPP